MNQFNPFPRTSYLLPTTAYQDQEVQAAETARQLFERAFLRSLAHTFLNWLVGRSDHLLDLNNLNMRSMKVNRHYAGVQVVPVRRIRGSEGRSPDFTAGFLPARVHLRIRWENIASLMLQGIPLPPIELIQVGEIYFVQDGHHRLLVSAALDRDYIDAEVTVWELDGPPVWETESPEKPPAFPVGAA